MPSFRHGLRNGYSQRYLLSHHSTPRRRHLSIRKCGGCTALSRSAQTVSFGSLGHHRLTTLSRASRGRESESLLHPARLPEEPGQRPPTIGPRLAPGEPRLEVWWLKKTRRRAMVSAAVPSVVGKPRSYPDLTKLVMIPSRFELGDASSERTGLHEKGFQGRDLLFGLSGCRSWQWGLSGLP
jgi:hypothetical protein